ncbi:MAG: UvrB/UvrC motif-containing protein [Phycisphaerae bacterium]
MGLCEHCKKAQATFHLTNISRDGEKIERHLCERCAIEEGLIQIHKPDFSTEILESFIASAKSASSADTNLVCDECGISYVEFRNQGLLGCPKDYDTFKEALLPLIERAHDGATHHTGKSPKSLGATRTTQQEIHRIKRQLEEAVAAEDYERAAELRDRIQTLESS